MALAMRRLVFVLLLTICACGTPGTYRYVSAVKDLPAGHTIKASDLQVESCSRPLGDICQSPETSPLQYGYVSDPAQVIGHKVVRDLRAGQIIVFVYIPVAKHQLPEGTIIKASDITSSQDRGDRYADPDVATDPSQVIGHRVLKPMGPGTISLNLISN
jgi:flagella basal body P-ring formation protein FlgA